MQRQVRQLALSLGVFGLAVAGCQKAEAPAPASAPATAPAPAGSVRAQATPVSAAAGEAFELKIRGPASTTAEQTGELVIELAAKPGYKINAEYPHNFRPEKDSGVQFDAPKFDLTAGAATTPCEKKAEDTCRLEAKVPFKALTRGEQKASGIAAFSVCNDEVCLIEKIPLTTTVLVN